MGIQLLEPEQRSDMGEAVKWVLSDPELLCLDGQDINYEAISAKLLVMAEEASMPEGTQAKNGRMGPKDVAPDRETASGQFAYYGNDGE